MLQIFVNRGINDLNAWLRRRYIVFACLGGLTARMTRCMVDAEPLSGLVRNICDHITRETEDVKEAALIINQSLSSFS